MANISPSDNTEHIQDMARATIKMVTDSIDAFVKKDIEIANIYEAVPVVHQILTAFNQTSL